MATTTRPVPTKGYEISLFEVTQFCRALGLDPAEVLEIHIADKRVIATVCDPKIGLGSSRQIVVPITESRKK